MLFIHFDSALYYHSLTLLLVTLLAYLQSIGAILTKIAPLVCLENERIMMKTKKLYLLRHAKSSWKDFSISDFDRPLNKRGKRDAPFMAEQMAKKGIHPDVILSSPAKRAKSTAQHFSEKLHTDIVYIDDIYEASTSTLKEIIKEAFQHYNEIMLVGHNPSLTMLSDSLTSHQIDNIPTAGIVGFEFEVETIEKAKTTMLFFEYPKKYD